MEEARGAARATRPASDEISPTSGRHIQSRGNPRGTQGVENLHMFPMVDGRLSCPVLDLRHHNRSEISISPYPAEGAWTSEAWRLGEAAPDKRARLN